MAGNDLDGINVRTATGLYPTCLVVRDALENYGVTL